MASAADAPKLFDEVTRKKRRRIGNSTVERDGETGRVGEREQRYG
jgi:hypothetical protein